MQRAARSAASSSSLASASTSSSLHFHLLEKPRLALRADAVNLASQLFDLEPQMRNEGVLRGCGGVRLGHLGFRSNHTRFAPQARRKERVTFSNNRWGTEQLRADTLQTLSGRPFYLV